VVSLGRLKEFIRVLILYKDRLIHSEQNDTRKDLEEQKIQSK
jgi:hypothetical protein